MKYKCLALYLMLYFYGQSLVFACEYTITIPKIESQKDQLIFNLLQLSLSKNITPEKVCIKSLDISITYGRKALHIQQGLLDLTWASASSATEHKLLPIRIPIFKGILGYRLFVIRKGEQDRYNEINNIVDLRQFVAGQGAFWGDTVVLTNSGIPIVSTVNDQMLWEMLERNRFDFLSIAIHEPWEELERYNEFNLAVEEKIILSYPSALFYYVNKENRALAEQITLGMKLALVDGSYDKLLYNSKMIQETIKYANLTERRVIKININNFHQQTPTSHLKYWLSHHELLAFISKGFLKPSKKKN